MARNYIQPGNTVTLPAPTGGVKSGDLVVVGSLAGIANYDAAEGAEVEITLVGVWSLPKATGAVNVGARIYWDAGAKKVTTTASGNTEIGTAVKAAGANDPTAAVRLNGVAV